MSTTKRATIKVDVTRIEADLLERGWNASDLARRSKLSRSRVSRFLSGEHQSAKTLARIAKSLGRTPSHYASIEAGVAA
jgi:transcriptional regulator with XRE-family HTH domain